ncbi:MotE family protein [Acidisphaera sp. L21]|uniref:MotE family protein n=1 Tax=Acidisphaera sp. L21 TaxID=1641851 RepID=UPI00131D88DF|nr:hypothetical protein [Acidisphaera sp. L21]
MNGWTLKPRLLPATLGMMGLLMATKTVTLGLAFLPVGSVVSSAEAAPAHEDAAAKPADAHGAAKPGDAKDAAKAGVERTASASPYAKPSVPSAPREPSAPPQPMVSDAEKQLLQDLRGRRQELDARAQALNQREAVMAAAEQKLSARVGELTALQTRLETLEKERQDHDEANWTGLVKVYETMKPREAAAIFNDMEMPVLLHVLDRMKDAKAALVLGAMQPDRARLATTQLAAQRTRSTTLPPPDHQGAG